MHKQLLVHFKYKESDPELVVEYVDKLLNLLQLSLETEAENL